MPKKRVEVPHAPRIVRSTCSKLDTSSEGLPNDKSYSATRLANAHAMPGIGRRPQRTSNYSAARGADHMFSLC